MMPIERGVPLIAVALTACGGAVGVDPRGLVEAEAPAEMAVADDGFLERLVAHAANQVCAVPGVIATRQNSYDDEVEHFVRALDQVSRALCEAGASGIHAGWSADGSPEILPGAEVLVEDSVLVIGEAWDGAAIGVEGTAGRSSVACGGRVRSEPDLTLFSSGGPITLTLDGQAGESFIWVRAADGSDICSNVESDDPRMITFAPASGPQRVWVGATDSELGDWELQVSRADHESRQWTPGAGTSVSVEVAIGQFTTPVPTDNHYQYCTGFIGTEPTLVVEVREPGYGMIEVDAPGDSVLYVEGPDGTVLCNDDYYDTNAGVSAYFEPGTWRVYVGSFSAGAAFSGTLYLD